MSKEKRQREENRNDRKRDCSSDRSGDRSQSNVADRATNNHRDTRQKQKMIDKPSEKPPVVEPHIEPFSAADYMFNKRDSKKVRTGTVIVLSAGQIFKTLLLSNNFHGYIYCRGPENNLDIVNVLETFVDRYSHAQFTFDEPECLRLLSSDLPCVLDDKDYKESTWHDIPAMFQSAVRDYFNKSQLSDGRNVFFRIDVKKSIETPVAKKPSIAYQLHPACK